MIQKIELIEREIDNKTKIKISLNKEDVEVFDYTTENPRRLILDFFISPRKKVVSTKNKKRRRPSSRGDAGDLTPQKLDHL